MIKHCLILIAFLTNTCAAKCQSEKYTLSGIISAPSGAPIKNVSVEIEWQDFYGKKNKSSVSNDEGRYLLSLDFDKYNGAGKTHQPEDMCTGSLQKVNITYYSAEYGHRTKALPVLKGGMIENIQF